MPFLGSSLGTQRGTKDKVIIQAYDATTYKNVVLNSPNHLVKVLVHFFADKETNQRNRPAIFALRMPKAALKKAVAAPQLVATFFSASLANLEGGV